jgi:hypothetical protein
MPNKAPAAAKGGQPKGATAAAGKAAPKADKK